MFIAFLNPQGNFDKDDSYWTEHPDFGGQLVYVKEVAIAIASQGHQVDIITRQIIDPDWPEFDSPIDRYPEVDTLRILRIPCGPKGFLPKEELWPYLGPSWVPNIRAFYQEESRTPEVLTAHYADGGLAATLLRRQMDIPFTFTAHSLGAQKMDKLGADRENIAALNSQYKFARRIMAERLSMNYAGRVITSTLQERAQQYGHPAYMKAIDPKNEARFALIPPGINSRIFNPTARAEDRQIEGRIEAALTRDVDSDRQNLPVILASSRLDPKKNHLGLVKAFASNPELQSRANLALSVRGVDDLFKEYQKLEPSEQSLVEAMIATIEGAELRGKVTSFPLNSQMELAAAYRSLARKKSVFALTALYEPFGLAPLEAMSCGLPVVVTDKGGPVESLRENGVEYGILVDPTNPEEIARGLLRLFRPDGEWDEFQRKGLLRVAKKYTWDRTALEYLQIFEQLLNEPNHRGEMVIPPYFLAPHDEEDIPLAKLSEFYFG